MVSRAVRFFFFGKAELRLAAVGHPGVHTLSVDRVLFSLRSVRSSTRGRHARGFVVPRSSMIFLYLLPRRVERIDRVCSPLTLRLPRSISFLYIFLFSLLCARRGVDTPIAQPIGQLHCVTCRTHTFSNCEDVGAGLALVVRRYTEFHETKGENDTNGGCCLPRRLGLPTRPIERFSKYSVKVLDVDHILSGLREGCRKNVQFTLN